MEEMRLQKFLAHSGVASRRASEEMILQGRVKVNGEKVTELGTKVYPGDEVFVDGKKIEDAEIVNEQFVPMGPAASQVAIKQTGTNG